MAGPYSASEPPWVRSPAMPATPDRRSRGRRGPGRGSPVVALESTIISHGLPRPANLETALRIEETVAPRGRRTRHDRGGRRQGVRRARRGPPGRGRHARRRGQGLAARRRRRSSHVAASARPPSPVTSHVAALAGIHVFATGGLGGVHREARDTWDESADLTTLGVTPVTVVCAGVKSILDVAATLERLETLNVGVVGYGTDQLPGLLPQRLRLCRSTGASTPRSRWRQIMAARRALEPRRRRSSWATRCPLEDALDPELHDRVLDSGLAAAARHGVRGKDVTPFLLDHFHRETARREPRGQRRRSCCATPSWPRPWPSRTPPCAWASPSSRDDVRRPRRRHDRRRLPAPRAARRSAPTPPPPSRSAAAAPQRTPPPGWPRAGSRSCTSAASERPARRGCGCRCCGPAGVDVRVTVDDARPTGTCVVLVSARRRAQRWCPTPGRTVSWSLADVPTDLWGPSTHLHCQRLRPGQRRGPGRRPGSRTSGPARRRHRVRRHGLVRAR